MREERRRQAHLAATIERMQIKQSDLRLIPQRMKPAIENVTGMVRATNEGMTQSLNQFQQIEGIVEEEFAAIRVEMSHIDERLRSVDVTADEYLRMISSLGRRIEEQTVKMAFRLTASVALIIVILLAGVAGYLLFH